MPFFVMTGINFFSSIPESMIEAAKIDGAREIQVLLKVGAPVSKPFLATLSPVCRRGTMEQLAGFRLLRERH